MLTFLIVAAVMAAVTLLDFPPVARRKETKATAAYAIMTVLALAILALHIFGANLPSIYGY